MPDHWTERTVMMPRQRPPGDANRIRVDLKNLPDGFAPKLRAMAAELGYTSFNDFVFDVLTHVSEYDGEEDAND